MSSAAQLSSSRLFLLLLIAIMRPEGNSLDLNNLPEEYGKQVEESSTTTAASTDIASPKKKAGGKDDASKVYECRFCSLKFCKSQALGGHMNRHRQERETETLNRARQLVFNNEGLAGAHMGLRDFSIGGSQPISPGSFQLHRGGGIAGDPCLQFRPVYPRLPSQHPHAPPLQPCTYPSTSPHYNAYPLPYQPPHAPPVGEYFIGHVLTDAGGSERHPPQPSASFTCVRAPLPAGAMQMGGVRSPTATREAAAPGNQTADHARNWGCSYGHA